MGLMLQFSCDCGTVFTGQTDRELILEVVGHAGQEHDMADAPAQTAVRVLDNIVEARAA
jgi:predicted small metal-binding protein